MDLSRVAEEMDFGDMVGDYLILSSVELSPDSVEQELRAVGNDGTFFGELPDTDGTSDALSEEFARSDRAGKVDHE